MEVLVFVTSFGGVLFIFIAILFAVESVLEARARRAAERVDTGAGPKDAPYYSWAYYTQSGQRFANWRGVLKLALSPGLVYRNRADQRTPSFTINSQGFRGPEIATTKQNLMRIILLGGSTAFGTGLSSDDETVSARLAPMLRAEVINAAVIGHRSGQEFVSIGTELLDLEPDLIVSLSGWNDFSQLWLSTMERRPLGFAAFELIDGKIEESERLVGDPMLARIGYLPRLFFPILIRRARNLWRRPKLRSGLQGVEWKIPLLAETYARNTSRTSALVHAEGARYVVLLQPVCRTTEPKLAPLLPYYEEFRRLVKLEWEKSGVPYADLNESGLADSLFFDLTHLTAAGQSELANLVADRLRQGGFLKSTLMEVPTHERLS